MSPTAAVERSQSERQHMASELEERKVQVNLPEMPPEINERLTESLREIIGADTVEVPANRPRPSQGERPRGGLLKRMTTAKAAVIGFTGVAVAIALVVVTALGGQWILTALAFVVLLLSLGVVTMSIIALSSVPEYPDPNLVALLGEHGVHDPEIRFSEIVMEFTPETGDHEERFTNVRDDPARAIAEQQGALTATSGPSESGANTAD
jgi:hypothetical protein